MGRTCSPCATYRRAVRLRSKPDGHRPMRHGGQSPTLGAGSQRQRGISPGGPPQLRGRLPPAAQADQTEKRGGRGPRSPGSPALFHDGSPAQTDASADLPPDSSVLPGAAGAVSPGRSPADGHFRRPVPTLGGRRPEKAGITAGQARANFGDACPRGDILEDVWEEFLSQQSQGGFCCPAAVPPGPPDHGRGHARFGTLRGGRGCDGLFRGGIRLVRQ